MARYFAPITPDELEEKIAAAVGEDGDVNDLIASLGRDIKVQFDTENVSEDADDFGPDAIIGVHTLDNGLTYRGYAAGGDWESPVAFIVYWDGKRLRGYVPTDGNPWNTDTNRAYGNHDDKDLKNAKKRYPDYYKNTEVTEFDPCDHDTDSELIIADIRNRILPITAKSAGDDESSPLMSADLWAYTIYAGRVTPAGSSPEMYTGFVRAKTREKAVKKLVPFVDKVFPPAFGWRCHFVKVFTLSEYGLTDTDAPPVPRRD